MNSPLARHLTRFSPFVQAVNTPTAAFVPAEPFVTLTTSELEARLDTERQRAERQAVAAWELKLSHLEAEQEAAMLEALQTARADWTMSQAQVLNAQLESGLETLRSALSDRIAAVLKPLLAEAIVGRAMAALIEALDRLLADPARPPITIRGPHDLIEMLMAARGTATGVAFQATDEPEVTMTAAGAHVETRLATALAAVSAEVS